MDECYNLHIRKNKTKNTFLDPWPRQIITLHKRGTKGHTKGHKGAWRGYNRNVRQGPPKCMKGYLGTWNRKSDMKRKKWHETEKMTWNGETSTILKLILWPRTKRVVVKNGCKKNAIKENHDFSLILANFAENKTS